MRSIRWIIFAMLVARVSISAAMPPSTLKRAYLDRLRRVHVIDASNRASLIDGFPAINLVMAPDRHSVAWSVGYKDKEGEALSDEVRIYRQGRVHRLPCGPASSDFAFRDGGRRLVLRCAGLHFAGLQELYDTDTLQVVASFQEAEILLEQRPDWNIDAD
ncbi:hypothetical protein ACI48D_25345 [Massilia sp. LXY-6]|uniref:hypothetical protein n=1 Tax=Massilia sp. LXY-6 TaxID=3379823 RepID=UPI003EDEF033